MKTMNTFIIVLILVTALPYLAVAQSQIPLFCKGDIETTTDGVKKREPATIDVLINLQDSTAEINGYWGCVAYMGDLGNECRGKLPVKITDAEILFAAQSSGDKYDGSSVFTINRYSGSMTTTSLAFAKPAAEAKWVMVMISAKMMCIKPEKKF